MRIKREAIDNALFVLGSLFTCALILATSTGQAQLSFIRQTPAATQASSVDPAPAEEPAVSSPQELALCQDPAILEAMLEPKLQLCTEGIVTIDSRLAALDFGLILESQHAKRREEPALFTETPTLIAEEPAQEPETNDECLNFQSLQVARGDELFSTEATHLLCESVGTSDGLYRTDSWTFDTIAGLSF